MYGFFQPIVRGCACVCVYIPYIYTFTYIHTYIKGLFYWKYADFSQCTDYVRMQNLLKNICAIPPNSYTIRTYANIFALKMFAKNGHKKMQKKFPKVAMCFLFAQYAKTPVTLEISKSYATIPKVIQNCN